MTKGEIRDNTGWAITGVILLILAGAGCFGAGMALGTLRDAVPFECDEGTRLYEPDGSYVLTYECEAPK